MPAPANLIHETSTTGGTGNLTLVNVNGKVNFSNATYGFGTGGTDVFDYFISDRDSSNWERGTGHMSDATTLVRDTVIESSNSDAAVNFTASNTLDITNDIPAASQVTTDTAQTISGVKTFSAAPSLPADTIDAITEIASAIKSGSDATLITGTAGTANNLAMWDANGDAVDSTVSVADVQQTDEEIQDIVGAMVTGNTETGIAVTYQDADGTLDFVTDVTKSGTSADSQIAVWTGDGPIEGTTGFTFDGSDFAIREAVNDGNPSFQVGATASEQLHLRVIYDTGAQTVDYVEFHTDVASATADKGHIRFSPDGSHVASFDDGGLDLQTGFGIAINGTDILTDSAGTATLSNIDALDATTEATIEAAIDTLANLTSAAALATVGTLTTGNADAIVSAASATTAGKVELATEAEVFTGTDTTRAVTPAELKPRESFIIACSDETTDLTTGTAKVTFRMPYAFELSDVRASVTTAPTGSVLTVDINESGTTILSTKLTIDATEKTSETAATAAVISDTTLADDAEMTIDIDGVGSTVAGAGLKVTLIGNRT